VANLGPRPAAFAGADPTAYSQWLASQAIAAEQQETGAPCAAATVASLGVSDASPPIVTAPPPGVFINISGVEHLQVQGCGRADQLNFLVFRLTTGPWMDARLLDGDSLTGPQLQHDALPIASGAIVAGAGCSTDAAAQGSVRMGRAQLSQRPTGAGSPWQELWTGSACGKSVTVLMTFTPDQNDPGTSISASIVPSGGQTPAQAGG